MSEPKPKWDGSDMPICYVGCPNYQADCPGQLNELCRPAIQQLRTDNARLQAIVDRLSKALPDPIGLRQLAEWLDIDDAQKGRTGHDEVQRDLRRWAEAAEAARKESEK